jgi:hypothetical protein
VEINDVINAVTSLTDGATGLQETIEAMPLGGPLRPALEAQRTALLLAAGGLRKLLFDSPNGKGTWPAPTGGATPHINQELGLPDRLDPSFGPVVVKAVVDLAIIVLSTLITGGARLPLRRTGGGDDRLLSFTFYKQGEGCFAVTWWQHISRDEYPKYRNWVTVSDISCSKIPASPPPGLWGPLPL